MVFYINCLNCKGCWQSWLSSCLLRRLSSTIHIGFYITEGLDYDDDGHHGGDNDGHNDSDNEGRLLDSPSWKVTVLILAD